MDHAVAQPAALLPAVDAREAEEPAQPELAVEPPAEGAMEEDEALDAAIARAIAQPEALPAVDARGAAQPGHAAADEVHAIVEAIARPKALRNADVRIKDVEAHRLAARAPCKHCGALISCGPPRVPHRLHLPMANADPSSLFYVCGVVLASTLCLCA